MKAKSNKKLIGELMARLPSGWVDMSSSKDRKPEIAWKQRKKTYFISIDRVDYRGEIVIEYVCRVKQGRVMGDRFSTSSLELMIDFIKEVVN